MPSLLNKKTRTDLLERATADLIALSSLDSIAPNSTLDATLRAITGIVADLYTDLEINFIASYASSAAGPMLDAAAQDQVIERLVFTTTDVPCGSDNIKLRTTNGSTLYSVLGILISTPFVLMPKGHLITSSTETGLVFELVETVVITPTSVAVDLGCQAQLDDGQIVVRGTLNSMDYSESSFFDTADTSLLEVVQNKDIVGIEQVESDESLRSRIFSSKLSHATGNEVSVQAEIEAHPDVSSSLLTKGLRGAGSYDVVVFPRRNRVSALVLNQFRSNLVSSASAGDNAKIVPPDYIPVSVALSVDPALISSAIVAIEEFMQSTSNKSLSYNILKKHLKSSGIENTITRLTIEYRDLLPSATLTLLPTEIFDLSPRVSGEKSITVV